MQKGGEMRDSVTSFVIGIFSGAFITASVILILDMEGADTTYSTYVSTKEAAKHECGEFDRLTGEFIWRKK